MSIEENVFINIKNMLTTTYAETEMRFQDCPLCSVYSAVYPLDKLPPAWFWSGVSLPRNIHRGPFSYEHSTLLCPGLGHSIFIILLPSVSLPRAVNVFGPSLCYFNFVSFILYNFLKLYSTYFWKHKLIILLYVKIRMYYKPLH